MIKRIFVFFLTCFLGTNVFSQDARLLKNFPGLFFGVEWNTLSGLSGVDFERTVYQKQKMLIGLKAVHVFKYKLSNLQLLNSSYEGTATFSHLMGTAQLFTGKNNYKGLLVHSGLGAGIRKREQYDVSQSRTYPAFEFGFGLQFPVSKTVSLKWTNSLTFAGEGGITLSKISLAF